VGDVELPGIGSAGGFGGRREDPRRSTPSRTSPRRTTIYRYDIETGESPCSASPKVAFDPADYETKQVFYRARTARACRCSSRTARAEAGRNNPTILYGYGGFNISFTPSFSVSNLVWMENGRRVRGAESARRRRVRPRLARGRHEGQQAERLRRLHRRGRVADRQRLHQPEKLAIRGGSNGGLLVGAA
jgi:prolyl oligopeptidase